MDRPCHRQAPPAAAALQRRLPSCGRPKGGKRCAAFSDPAPGKDPGAKLVWCIGMLGSELLPVLRQGAEQYKAITGDNSVYLLELPNTTPET